MTRMDQFANNLPRITTDVAVVAAENTGGAGTNWLPFDLALIC